MEVINDLIFSLKYALFDSSRTRDNYEKIRQTADIL